jgi:hypothetical protein
LAKFPSQEGNKRCRIPKMINQGTWILGQAQNDKMGRRNDKKMARNDDMTIHDKIGPFSDGPGRRKKA